MSNYVVSDTSLTSIADAIRTKGGTQAQLEYPQGFVNAIGAIQGGKDVDNDVLFLDYDGTVLHDYTAAQFAQLTEMPANPNHTDIGLTADGWNWSLADAKAYVATYGALDIGQMYRPTSGKTEIDIDLDDPNYLSPWISFYMSGTVVIDWGDTQTDTVTESSFARKYIQHTYNQTGKYTIKLDKQNGSCYFQAYNTSYPGILFVTNNFNSNNDIYQKK